MVRALLLLALTFSDGDAGVSPPAGAEARALHRRPALPTLLSPLPPEPSPAPADEYQLRRAKDGTGDLLYETSGFDARVARDGSVSFHDKHVTEIKIFPFWPLPWSGPSPMGVPTLQTVVLGFGKKLRDARAPRRSDPTAGEIVSPSTTVSRYRPDTREVCQYPRACFFDASALLVRVSAQFDTTDEVMRFAGQDPYRYQKARFLTGTRDLRIHMAGRAHAEDVSRSAASLPGLLDTIACDERLTVGERRSIIEALRAELDVATPEARAYGEQIRRFLDALDHADGGARCSPR